MNLNLEFIMRSVSVGIGATLVMDAWLLLLRRMGIPTLNMAFLGRWIGHLPRGRFVHNPISRTEAVKGERLLGWCAHYAIGIGFAALLLFVFGLEWARSPSLLPALFIGAGTVLAPLMVLQPALGAGVASLKTPSPLKNCLKSLVSHTVFGLGLYLAAVATKF